MHAPRHHTFKKQSSLEDVLGESREKRPSVSELVSEEFRKPFTLAVDARLREGARIGNSRTAAAASAASKTRPPAPRANAAARVA